MLIVLDTNVLVAGLRASGGRSRAVLRRAIDGLDCPLFGTTLWLEYEAVLARPMVDDLVSPADRRVVMKALAASGRWARIAYRWRPNLPDEADNHLIELAVAGGAQAIVTWNVRDLGRGELVWPGLRVLSPPDYLTEVT